MKDGEALTKYGFANICVMRFQMLIHWVYRNAD